MTRLPFRIEAGIARVLGASAVDLAVVQSSGDQPPRLRGTLPRPATANVSFVLRVHTRTGIPVASVPVDISRGDESFETPGVSFLGMEGYAHLRAAQLRNVESRVWSRRAYATGASAGVGRAGGVK